MGGGARGVVWLYSLGMAKKAAGTKAAGVTDRGDLGAGTTMALLLGKDFGLQTKYSEELRAAMKKAHGEFDTVRFDGESMGESTAAEVLDECRSFGLMAAHKLVVLDNAERVILGETLPLFTRYAEAPAEGATLLMRGKGLGPSNFLKAVVACPTAAVRKCEPPTVPQAVSRVREFAKLNDATIAPDAANLLVQRLGTDLARLEREIEKLAVAAGRGGAITVELILELAGEGYQHENAFPEVKDAIAMTRPEQAIRTLRHIFDNSSSDAGVMAVIAAAQTATNIHMVAAGNAAGIRGFNLKKLAGWGGAADAILAAATRLDPLMTIDLLDDAVDAERRSKSGLGTGERAAERIALRLSGALHPSRGARGR